MAIGSLLSTGVAGMQRSSSEIHKSARDIAEAGIVKDGQAKDGQDVVGSLVEPIVNMKFEQLIFEASAKVVSTADSVLGTLIDIKT